MKVVILAAGEGKRLGAQLPKALVDVYEGKTILDFQLEKLLKKVRREDIYVVVGYRKELIMHKYFDLGYIYNPFFNTTNTAKSLLCAVRKLDDDVLILNGDVYFEEEVLDLLLASNYSSCLVNTNQCSDEEMKYTLKNGYIYELSKEVQNGLGEAVGINLIKRGDLKKVLMELEKVSSKDYFEKAFENLTLRNELILKPIDISRYFVHEIDFREDVTVVKNFIKSSLKVRK